MDCSLPGSSARGIFQARILEWDAISYFNLLIKEHINKKNNRELNMVMIISLTLLTQFINMNNMCVS